MRLYSQYSYLHEALALPNFFPLLSVYDPDEGWWKNTAHPYGDAVFSQTANFDVTLIAPADWVVIASGIRTADILNADQTRTHHYIAPLMRDFAIMASPHYETVTGEQDGISIDVHYFTGGELAAVAVLTYARDAVRFFNQEFGPYPYAELDIVETHTTAGGIEYPGLIVLQSDSWNPRLSYLEIVAAHEIAHQWWYSLVGNDQTRYPWLDESLAQYATALYLGEVYGPEFQLATFDLYTRNWQQYLERADDLTIGASPGAYVDKDAYTVFVYYKGPLFFEKLAELTGEDALLDALQDYFAAYHYAIVTPAQLQASLEESLQLDLDALFMEWVGETN
jgi:aminopeptidase N